LQRREKRRWKEKGGPSKKKGPLEGKTGRTPKREEICGKAENLSEQAEPIKGDPGGHPFEIIIRGKEKKRG